MADVVRVRYAPSPTGHLHIGGARTALFNYLFARKHGGRFVVRFEDTDQTRHVESGIASQLEGLRWLGLDWDESVDVGGPFGPYRQSERLPLYRPFVERLLEQGRAYHCYCTEEELERQRAERERKGASAGYSGRCRLLSPQEVEAFRAEGRRPSIRFRVPEGRIVAFEDRIRGRVEFSSDDIGDFVIVRADGMPTYNFAVVLDDHLMGITHVIRGEEHLSNTPRQLLLYEAFGWTPPEFAHLPLILNPDRKKMSKRDESVVQFVEQYRELGYLPEALLNFIALLGWSPKDTQELLSREELTERFGLEGVQKSPAVFDTDKLNWMNGHYIRSADAERLTEMAMEQLRKAGRMPADPSPGQREWVAGLVALYRDQLRYMAEIVPLSDIFFADRVERFDDEAVQALAEPSARTALGAFRDVVVQTPAAPGWTEDAVKAMFREAQRLSGLKGRMLYMPVRAALTGSAHGPDLAGVVRLLGRDTVLSRLGDALARLP
ncbi:MAG: glutamate--tRNA ligase [Candidatus Reconcilbacillus cellulovorans]|uniref:Glutamate--tRNA ligase n=1 Tax=Candidatus Reconcilbacillus cellulovorans TaxID=1906605 RepID=A0A2A6E2T4_9BACL|nr:MAG: glutamate--tRNA ligase [Candidatus Reconcilbacillus cellulovorans]